MRILSATFAKLSLVAVLLIAMVSMGFAHRVSALDIDDDLISYLAAGGALSDICDDANGGTSTQGCDACRLVDGASVPQPIANIAVFTERTCAETPSLVAVCIVCAVPERAHPTRAPPVV